MTLPPLVTSSSIVKNVHCSTKDSNGKEDPHTFLLSWGSHSDESFHYFTDEEAKNIRKALTVWYRKNRRKLPWRGDSPPYDGSTAGYSANSKHEKKAKIEKVGSITNYFTTKKTKKKNDKGKGSEGHGNKKIDSGNDKSISDTMDQKYDSKQTSVSAYGVWVSEIMLQQTRVEAVIPYYIRWMKSFPTVERLADATDEEVNSHWAGLGFYRRARYLHNGAKQVVELHNGTLPSTVKGLLTISGIGPYTAGAIASIAYNENVPVVDGNVCRVLARLKGIANHIKAPVLKDDIGWKLASQIIDAGTSSSDSINDYGSAGEINQALMELGATYCSPSGSGMDDDDPLKEFYVSTKISSCIAEIMNKTGGETQMLSILEETANRRASKSATGETCKVCDDDGIASVFDQIIADLQTNPTEVDAYTIGSLGHAAIPIPPPKKKKREEVLAVAVLCDTTPSVNHRKRKQSMDAEIEQRWLLIQRPAKGLLAGQWEFPAVCVWSSVDASQKSKGSNSKKTQTVSSKSKSKSKSKASTEVPIIEPSKRTNAMDTFLEHKVLTSSSFDDDTAVLTKSYSSLPRRKVGKVALEHIFSHVRHSMWIEYASVEYPKSLPSSWTVRSLMDVDDSAGTSEERVVRWMSEEDMKSVGITSGVKKILAAVKNEREMPKLKKRK